MPKNCLRLMPQSTYMLILFITSSLWTPGLVRGDNFNSGAQGWQVYDYNGLPYPQQGGSDVFYPVTWASSGGVGNSGYIWGDDSRWRIDIPENPDSVLSLIFYRNWIGAGPIDLRNKTLSVYLRGDNLDLHGAGVYFWAHVLGTRWHYMAEPLDVSDGQWGQQQTIVLRNDENLWHRTWSASSKSLDYVLTNCESYGFSFIGFPAGVEVTGRFSMDEFTISVPEPKCITMLIIGTLCITVCLWQTGRRDHIQ